MSLAAAAQLVVGGAAARQLTGASLAVPECQDSELSDRRVQQGLVGAMCNASGGVLDDIGEWVRTTLARPPYVAVVTCVNPAVKAQALIAEGAGPQALVKVERPQRSEDERP